MKSLLPVESTLEYLVRKAKEGDKNALEELIRRIQDRIYRLALRMLYLPVDAEDATQEILIKIITHLDSFEGRSKFTTWAYRIAYNHLMNARKGRAEKLDLSFEDFKQITDKLPTYPIPGDLNEIEMKLMAKEVKLMCTNGMLQALRRDIRLAFIIGEIFGASSREGAEIFDISPEAFRQRLSRGRKQIHEFMGTQCSLVRPNNPCECIRRIEPFINRKWLDPQNPVFITHPYRQQKPEIKEHLADELDEFVRITAIFRSHPDYTAPESFVGIVKELVDSGRFELFNNQ